MFDNIKVIAADIDGTLAKTAVNPSVYTLDTIRDLQDAGYLFGLPEDRLTTSSTNTRSGALPDSSISSSAGTAVNSSTYMKIKNISTTN